MNADPLTLALVGPSQTNTLANRLTTVFTGALPDFPAGSDEHLSVTPLSCAGRDVVLLGMSFDDPERSLGLRDLWTCLTLGDTVVRVDPLAWEPGARSRLFSDLLDVLAPILPSRPGRRVIVTDEPAAAPPQRRGTGVLLNRPYSERPAFIVDPAAGGHLPTLDASGLKPLSEWLAELPAPERRPEDAPLRLAIATLRAVENAKIVVVGKVLQGYLLAGTQDLYCDGTIQRITVTELTDLQEPIDDAFSGQWVEATAQLTQSAVQATGLLNGGLIAAPGTLGFATQVAADARFIGRATGTARDGMSCWVTTANARQRATLRLSGRAQVRGIPLATARGDRRVSTMQKPDAHEVVLELERPLPIELLQPFLLEDEDGLLAFGVLLRAVES